MSSRALAALFFVAGCTDPIWKAEGFVIDAFGVPITGASVALVCPNEEQSLDTVKTTAAGRFEVGGHNATRAMGCSLEVSKPGKHLKTVRMMDVCFRSKKTQNYDLPCGARREDHARMKRVLFFVVLVACKQPPLAVDGSAPTSTDPPTTCTKLGSACTVSPGKLGTCVEIEKTSGESSFVCQSQH